MKLPIKKTFQNVPVAGAMLLLLHDAEERKLKDLVKIYRNSLIRLCEERLKKLAKGK